MAETTSSQGAQIAGDIAAAARERGMEQLEGAKGQLAEGAERIAAAVERTADELGDDGETSLTGFGHSVASLMRQLAGGLRERDVEEFARELGALARRNPGVFLAGSVAVGFGVARFFKAHTPGAQADDRWQDSGDWQAGDWQGAGWQDRGDWQGGGEWQRSDRRVSGESREDFDADESLDLSASAPRRGDDEDASPMTSGSDDTMTSGDAGTRSGGPDTIKSGGATSTASRDEERSSAKSRPSGKSKASKPQRAGGGSSPTEASREASTERAPAAGAATTNTDTTATGGGSRGGKQ